MMMSLGCSTTVSWIKLIIFWRKMFRRQNSKARLADMADASAAEDVTHVIDMQIKNTTVLKNI